MPALTRRRLLSSAGVLFALSGCAAERSATSETTTSAADGSPDRVSLEVRNRDAVARTLTVVVILDGERQFRRTLSLDPGAETELEAVAPLPDSAPSEIRVGADPADGGSTGFGTTLEPGDDGGATRFGVSRESAPGRNRRRARRVRGGGPPSR